MIRLAGVIVLFNPDHSVISNIRSYINDLDVLYAVDNSEKKNIEVIQEIKGIGRVVYINNHGNKGIAHAQNRGARQAIRDRYSWLLTLDQDSYADKNMVPILLDYINTHDTKSLGIVTAYQKNKRDKRNFFLQEFQQVMHTMSSGNLLNLKAYQDVGGFENKLFIEIVDFEYCLRLNQHGYRVIKANKAILHHNLGDINIIDNMVFYSHNPFRQYYYVRNQLYVEHKYKDIFPSWVKERHDYSVKRYIRILLYENNRLKNLYYMVRGWIDYKRNRFGKLK